jgi:hypothetical protein
MRYDSPRARARAIKVRKKKYTKKNTKKIHDKNFKNVCNNKIVIKYNNIKNIKKYNKI